MAKSKNRRQIPLTEPKEVQGDQAPNVANGSIEGHNESLAIRTAPPSEEDSSNGGATPVPAPLRTAAAEASPNITWSSLLPLLAELPSRLWRYALFRIVVGILGFLLFIYITGARHAFVGAFHFGKKYEEVEAALRTIEENRSTLEQLRSTELRDFREEFREMKGAFEMFSKMSNVGQDNRGPEPLPPGVLNGSHDQGEYIIRFYDANKNRIQALEKRLDDLDDQLNTLSKPVVPQDSLDHPP